MKVTAIDNLKAGPLTNFLFSLQEIRGYELFDFTFCVLVQSLV